MGKYPLDNRMKEDEQIMTMTIQERIDAARKEQAQILDYTQEQVDKLVFEIAKVIYLNA